MRQAVERNFEIIGEALKRLAATDPTTAAGMSQVSVLLSEACALIGRIRHLHSRKNKSAREISRITGLSPKPTLKADKDAGVITLDSETTLAGLPPEAWRYLRGNRCAIDWVLDQHEEKKPKDPTIRAKFDTYRFADHKENVIDLLARVTTVSVETMRITVAMRGALR